MHRVLNERQPQLSRQETSGQSLILRRIMHYEKQVPSAWDATWASLRHMHTRIAHLGTDSNPTITNRASHVISTLRLMLLKSYLDQAACIDVHRCAKAS